MTTYYMQNASAAPFAPQRTKLTIHKKLVIKKPAKASSATDIRQVRFVV
jgi:hypothetical protein